MTRAHGTGRIFQRGRVWWISYYGPRPLWPGKKRFFESSGSEKESDAKRLLQRRLKASHGDRFVGPMQEKVTVAELLRQYQTHR